MNHEKQIQLSFWNLKLLHSVAFENALAELQAMQMASMNVLKL